MIDKYRGIPYRSKGRDFRGVDCWGLLYLFNKTELGIIIPSHDAEYENSNKVNFVRVANKNNFQGWRKVEKPEVGCAALFRIGPMFHVGVFVEKGKGTLSIFKNEFVELINPKEILWKDRFRGWWKYDR